MKALRYKAFMSYCHADESWAVWLHKALESYRVPRRLVGETGLHGTVPSKLSPIFRDRDELSSATDLSARIREALAESESLLVICSPASARSRWVNEEIRYFRSLKRGRIYCVIIDGEPKSSDPQDVCFPAALLERDDHQAVEPLAADVRRQADGKSLAKLKLVAAILGVRLDELRQREQQRKRKSKIIAGIAFLVVMALVLTSIQSRLAERDTRKTQEVQQASAESMLARFLEQSERLADVAELETRKAFGEVMSSYFADFDPADLTKESRRQLGVALSNRGVILLAEDDLAQAMEVFQNAHQTLQLLVDNSEGDKDSLFELSQTKYWIGQVHLNLGRVDEAGKWFNAYAEVGDALHSMQPDNADWTMEAAYAQSNLGALEMHRARSDPRLVIEYYQSALQLNEEAARQDHVYERELANSHADLADAWLAVCDLTQATTHRRKNVELAALHLSLNPASNRMKEDLANALSGLYWVQQQSGNVEQALDSLRQSLVLITELVEEDPSNLAKRWNLVMKSSYQPQLLQLSGDESESWRISVAVERDMKELMEQDQDMQISRVVQYGMFLRDFSYRAYLRGEWTLADRLLGESIVQLEEIARRHPDTKNILNELAMSYFYYWDQNDDTLPNDSATLWLSNAREASNHTGCTDLNVAARLSVMSDDKDQARIYTSQLIERGYQEPEFIRFCQENDLCSSGSLGSE